MLNTGHVFSLPVESSYSRQRRFFSANQCQKDIQDQGIFKHLEFLGYDENYQSEYRSLFGKPYRFTRIHQFLIENLSSISRQNRQFKLAKHSRRYEDKYRPLKHCKLCAENGYHSMIFSYEWINQCPIHFEPLINKCPGCKKQWPTLGEITKRKCKICGIKPNQIKFNSNYSNGMGIYKPFFRFKYIIDQFIPKVFERVYLSQYQPCSSYSRKNINTPSALALSVLVSINRKTNEILELQKLLLIPKIKLCKKSYRLLPFNYKKKGDRNYELYARERRVILKLSNKLKELCGFNLYSVKNNEKINQLGVTRECSKFIIWNMISGDMDLDINNENYLTIKAKVRDHCCKVPIRNMKLTPIEISFNKSFDFENKVHYFIPDEFRMFLFEYDHKRLMTSLLYQYETNQCLRQKVISWESIFQISLNLLRLSTKKSLDIVIVRKEKIIDVYFDEVKDIARFT